MLVCGGDPAQRYYKVSKGRWPPKVGKWQLEDYLSSFGKKLNDPNTWKKPRLRIVRIEWFMLSLEMRRRVDPMHYEILWYVALRLYSKVVAHRRGFGEAGEQDPYVPPGLTKSVPPDLAASWTPPPRRISTDAGARRWSGGSEPDSIPKRKASDDSTQAAAKRIRTSESGGYTSPPDKSGRTANSPSKSPPKLPQKFKTKPGDKAPPFEVARPMIVKRGMMQEASVLRNPELFPPRKHQFRVRTVRNSFAYEMVPLSKPLYQSAEVGPVPEAGPSSTSSSPKVSSISPAHDSIEHTPASSPSAKGEEDVIELGPDTAIKEASSLPKTVETSSPPTRSPSPAKELHSGYVAPRSEWKKLPGLFTCLGVPMKLYLMAEDNETMRDMLESLKVSLFQHRIFSANDSAETRNWWMIHPRRRISSSKSIGEKVNRMQPSAGGISSIPLRSVSAASGSMTLSLITTTRPVELRTSLPIY